MQTVRQHSIGPYIISWLALTLLSSDISTQQFVAIHDVRRLWCSFLQSQPGICAVLKCMVNPLIDKPLLSWYNPPRMYQTTTLFIRVSPDCFVAKAKKRSHAQGKISRCGIMLFPPLLSLILSYKISGFPWAGEGSNLLVGLYDIFLAWLWVAYRRYVNAKSMMCLMLPPAAALSFLHVWLNQWKEAKVHAARRNGPFWTVYGIWFFVLGSSTICMSFGPRVSF